MFYFFYYFPLGLDVRPRRPAWATWMLVGACTAVFLLEQAWPEPFWLNWGALVFIPSSPSLSSLVLNAYMHGGWLHLVGNMITLAVFGPPLEDRLGSSRFLVLYHLSNIVANLVQGALVLIVMPAMADAGVLGASGAIAGVMGMFLIRLYFARLKIGYWAFMPLQAFVRGGTVTVPVCFAIVVWFCTQFAMAVLQREGVAAGVACGSHLGGLLGGVGFALLLHQRTAAVTERILQRGCDYRNRGLWYPAQGEFMEYLRRVPGDEAGHLELARCCRLTGAEAMAAKHYRAAGRIVARAKRSDRLEEIAAEAERTLRAFAFEPQQQMQLAQARERGMNADGALRAYEALTTAAPHAPEAPLALFRAWKLATKIDSGRAVDLHTRLCTEYPFAPESAIASLVPPRAA